MPIASSSMSPGPRRWRSTLGRLCLMVSLAGAIGGALSHVGVASAYEACRSDPVLLVNGAIVDVVSTLQTTPGAVRELDYTVTVPPGGLLSIVRLTVGLGFPEKVTFVHSAAQPWGTMRIDATVQTQPGVAPFPTTVQATALLLLANSTASGLSNSTVTVSLGHMLML
mgnify:CR=1 FL=1